MENDIKEVLSSEDLDEPERHTRLLRLKESCEQYKRLADKLERFPFDNAEQAATIRQYCTRYRGLLEMFEQAMLPTPRVVPIHVESPPGSSMDMRRPTASAVCPLFFCCVDSALTTILVGSDVVYVHRVSVRSLDGRRRDRQRSSIYRK